MVAVHDSPLADLLSSIGDCLTPEVAKRLVVLRAPEKYQRRIETLAEKSTEGQLSAAEAEEYRSLVTAGNVMAVLQSKARQLIAR